MDNRNESLEQTIDLGDATIETKGDQQGHLSDGVLFIKNTGIADD